MHLFRIAQLTDAQIAAEAGRLDLTQLLYALGVKPSLTHSGQSIFAAAASILRHDIGGPETSIELFHYILQTVDPATDFDNPSWTRQDYKELWHWQMGEWLWRQRDYVNADISSLSEICLRCLLRHMWDYTMYRADQAAAILKEYLTPDILRRIERNELTFLDDLFWNSGRNLLAERRRFHIGRFWLDNLEAAGVHIDNYLRHELDAHPGRLIIGKTYLECDLLIQMGWTREGGYRLGWEYEFDHTTGGAVVLAFAEMCVHCDDGEWPYVDWDHDDDIIAKEERTEERFDRRMEKKARRLEKMGRRTEKSSAMPGSWID
ncbi:hypothetical protein BDV95DRAFT_169340 [Massariosphaeria phaeospora]|uniref:Uncharacterized protein n=1 Tax=Massariosphaeria phaeospora TaxID=100035 RepID=A0A7C8M705_9PLEO|nr:hypothetical protein BDV95DRAFT_169340 [Massariosphaeria phaeospora]